MPAPFNYTNMSTLKDVFVYANQVTSPTGAAYFGDLLVASVWIIVWGVFVNTYTERPQLKAMIVSSFAAFFFAVSLDLLSLVDRLMVGLPFAALALSIVADKIWESGE